MNDNIRLFNARLVKLARHLETALHAVLTNTDKILSNS